MKKTLSFLMLAFLMVYTINAQIDSKTNTTINANQNITPSLNPKAVVLSADFENGLVPPTGWTLVSTAPTTWALKTVLPITGTYSASCAYDAALNAQNEKLISPVIDLTAAASLSFNWNGSYYWSVSPNDNCDLDVYVSTNGGTTWGATPVWSEPTTTWVNWQTYPAVVDLAAFAGQSNCKIAIIYTGTDGAEFSVDDILITNTVGINDINKQSDAIKVYPNPANNNVSIVANNQNIQTIKVLNIAGQVIQEFVVNNQDVQLNVSNYDAGVYFVQVKTENGFFTKRINVTK